MINQNGLKFALCSRRQKMGEHEDEDGESKAIKLKYKAKKLEIKNKRGFAKKKRMGQRQG